MKERASTPQSRVPATAPRRPAHAPDGLAVLQRSAGNRATADLLAPRPVQRIGLDDLVDAVTGSAAGPGDGIVSTVGGAIAGDAQQGTLGSGTLTRAAEAEQARERSAAANVTSSEKSYDSFVDSAVAGVSGLAHDAAGAVSGIPVVGGVADLAAGAIDQTAHFSGGFAKEGVGIGAGLSRMVQDPLGFQQGLSAQAAQGATPLGINAYFDSLGKVSRGEEGLGGAASDILDAVGKGKENEIRAQMGPLQGAIGDASKGDYAGAAGRLGAQGLVAVLGMGEAGPLGELGAAESATAAEGESAAAAAENAPVTVRDPLPAGQAAGEAAQLSPPAQRAFEQAIAAGKSPEAALAEARSFDFQAKAQGLGQGGGVRVDPSVSPEPPPQVRVAPNGPVRVPSGLSPDGQEFFKSLVRSGSTPEEAEAAARNAELIEGDSAGAGENARGRTRQRGAGKF